MGSIQDSCSCLPGSTQSTNETGGEEVSTIRQNFLNIRTCIQYFRHTPARAHTHTHTHTHTVHLDNTDRFSSEVVGCVTTEGKEENNGFMHGPSGEGRERERERERRGREEREIINMVC